MRLFPEDTAAALRRDGWWSGRTWTDLLARHVDERPDHLALVDPANRETFLHGAPARRTWREVADLVERFSRVLFAHGVRRDSMVGVQLPNVAELPVALLAVERLGAIATPFPVQYGRHELTTMGSGAGLEVMLTAHAVNGRELAADAATLAETVPTLRHVLAVGPGEAPGVVGIDALLRAADSDVDDLTAHLASLDRDANDCVTLVWTSGTEGVPKGVPRAHGDWEVLSTACSQAPRLTPDDVLLNPFPMVNGGGLAGMFLPWLTLGATLVQHHPFDLDVFLEQVEAERVTYTCAPPLVLDALVADEETFARRDLTSLRAVGSGSAPLSGWMIERWERDHGVEVLNLFGSNEGGVLFGDPDTVPDPTRRGRFFPRHGRTDMPYRVDVAHAMRSRLVDLGDGSEITAPGRPGELRLKGPTIFSGYWGRGRHGFDEDGWFCTGDVFEISADDPRYLTHVDRAKDLIIRGGYKISAAEIEALVVADDRVAEVAAVAMPDQRLGERVCLFVVPRPGLAPPTLEDLVERLSDAGVARFKWPERLEVVDALPRNPVGKILKRELRERLAAPTLPRIRQVVLLVPDLDAALDEARSAFGFAPGARDAASMAELGFEHEVCAFGDTFVEICAPLSEDSVPGRLVARRGAIGYMLVVQVPDLQVAVDRAAAADLAPLFAQDFEGNRISQWHPKSLGTLAELDEISPPESWHFAPRVFDASSTDVARDVVAADIAVPDPTATARAWSHVLGVEPADATSFALGPTVLRLVPAAGEATGLVAVDVVAADASRIGDVIHLGGVDFRLVEGASA